MDLASNDLVLKILQVLYEVVECPLCGTRIRFGDIECPHCGKDLDDDLLILAERLISRLQD